MDEWVGRKIRVKTILHYLDNFLVAVSLGSTECIANVTLLLCVFKHLGMRVVVNKLEDPSPVLILCWNTAGQHTRDNYV